MKGEMKGVMGASGTGKKTAAAKKTLTARDGYYKLAFGDVSDALELVFAADGEPANIKELDLFNVAEIRQGKNGLELRFFDRLEALDRLAALEAQTQGGGFFEAVREAASAMGGADTAEARPTAEAAQDVRGGDEV